MSTETLIESLSMKENVMLNYFQDQVSSKPINKYILYSDPKKGIHIEHRGR